MSCAIVGIVLALFVLPRALVYCIAFAGEVRKAWREVSWLRAHVWVPVQPDGLAGGYWMPRHKDVYAEAGSVPK